MQRGTYPGVYTREISSGVRTISGVPTAIAAFVGPSRTGIDKRPIRVLNFGDYERSFGGLVSDSEMSYGVLHFFQNGGGEALIVRVPRTGAVAASITAASDAAAAIKVDALSSGLSGNDIFLDVESPVAAGKTFALSVTQAATGVREAYSGLSTDATSLGFAKSVVNDPDLGSKLVSLGFTANVDAPASTGTIVAITATPAFFADASKTALADMSLKIALSKVDATTGASVAIVAETEMPLFAKDEEIPRSHLLLARLLEQRINRFLVTRNAGIEVEVTLLDFRAAGQALRFRTKVLAFQTATGGGGTVEHPAPDGIVSIMDGVDPAAGNKLFALYGLAAATVNVSRYRLGRTYAAGLSKTSAPTAGSAGSAPPTSGAMIDGVEILRKADLFNLVCIPDAVRAKDDNPDAPFYSNYSDIYTAAKTLCEDKRAFLLVDTPPNVQDVDQAQAWKTGGFGVRTSHAAAYFPRLKMSDPLNPGALRAFAPSGSMAGVMARTDANRGVWKAPAGIDAAVAGVFAPALVLSDQDHGLLNPVGLNCFRKFPIYGSVAFGARTLAGADEEASEWKYVPVRRTALYMLESLRRGLTWVVFEPNDEPTWSAIRMNVTAFMQGMFRQSAFQGRSPRDAYLVKCDGETTQQTDINLGMVNVVVGFAPLKPAEFVFITLQQLAGQAQR